jgi:hypothetical protein
MPGVATDNLIGGRTGLNVGARFFPAHQLWTKREPAVDLVLSAVLAIMAGTIWIMSMAVTDAAWVTWAAALRPCAVWRHHPDTGTTNTMSAACCATGACAGNSQRQIRHPYEAIARRIDGALFGQAGRHLDRGADD